MITTLNPIDIIQRGGFLPQEFNPAPISGPLPPSTSLLSRFEHSVTQMPSDLQVAYDQMTRGEFTGDPNQFLAKWHEYQQLILQRAITTQTTAFPVRENLEAEAVQLMPTDTPVRNRLPRVPGAGTAVNWKTITSLGGGWGSTLDQLGGGSATQYFFSETGAPGEVSTVYANKNSSYKLMGIMGGISGFAMAAGANFQNQYARERINSLRNFMLLEENALINGSSTATAAPWGDGANALAYDGWSTCILQPKAYLQPTFRQVLELCRSLTSTLS